MAKLRYTCNTLCIHQAITWCLEMVSINLAMPKREGLLPEDIAVGSPESHVALSERSTLPEDIFLVKPESSHCLVRERRTLPEDIVLVKPGSPPLPC